MGMRHETFFTVTKITAILNHEKKAIRANSNRTDDRILKNQSLWCSKFLNFPLRIRVGVAPKEFQS